MTKKLVRRVTTIEEFVYKGDGHADADVRAREDDDDQHGQDGDDDDAPSRRDGMRILPPRSGARSRVRPGD
jgi:hypothetical protein